METSKKRYNIKSEEDLKKIPNYRFDIDHKREPLKLVIQRYYVTPMIKCGLTGCHKWHNEGYLVELENGFLTNVGHVCGGHFGDRFEAERIRYLDSVLRPQLLQTIREGKIRLESLKSQIETISYSASLLSARKSEFKKRFPKISSELHRRAFNNDLVVSEDVARTSSEIEDMMAANPYQSRDALRYRQVEKGRIAGLQIFTVNVREKINVELSSKSQTISALDFDTSHIKTDDLIQWESWIKTLDDRLAEATDFISKAQKFFTEENYQLIASLPSPADESFLLKQLKTAALDISSTGEELQVAMQGKKLNRKERRKLQYSSNVHFYKESA